MDFFQKHDKALRKGRLLQAASTLFVAMPYIRSVEDYNDAFKLAVSQALRLEKEIEKELELRG